MLPLLSSLSPNAAVLLLTFGLLLIAVELNRPGLVLPGAFGLLILLLACASLASRHPSLEAELLSVGFIALLAWNMSRISKVRWLAAVAFICGLTLSIARLLPGPSRPRISPWVALLSGLLIGAGTTILTRIARRARKNKGLD